GDMTLEELIELVRQNELLYERIDFTWRCKYETFNRDRLAPDHGSWKTILEEEQHLRLVYQPPYMLRRQQSLLLYRNDEKKELPYYVGYDGEKTRVLFDRGATVSNGYVKQGLYITPHNLLVHRWADIPLSLYLAGTDAINRSQWKVGFKGSVQTYYKGVEEWRGLRCHHVYIHHFVPGRGDSGAIELWLAEERNFIPARAVGYAFWLSRTDPDGGGEVTEWRELEPGIWFPWRVQMEAHYIGQLAKPGTDNRLHRHEISFETVQLHPEHDVSFFRFDFPPGTYVYEVQGQEILKSYQVGTPADPQVRPAAPLWRQWRWWLGLGLAVCLFGCIGLVQYRRRRRGMAVSASTGSEQV
ncbi:MAG: hypothetical protein K6T86_19005, partial [Pirellulales bacterium]|nr:hypothetical protein [Pirellulales bacterium]